MNDTVNIFVVAKLYASGIRQDINRSMTLAEIRAFVGPALHAIPASLPRHALVTRVHTRGSRDPLNASATLLIRDDQRVPQWIRGDALLITCAIDYA